MKPGDFVNIPLTHCWGNGKKKFHHISNEWPLTHPPLIHIDMISSSSIQFLLSVSELANKSNKFCWRLYMNKTWFKKQRWQSNMLFNIITLYRVWKTKTFNWLNTFNELIYNRQFMSSFPTHCTNTILFWTNLNVNIHILFCILMSNNTLGHTHDVCIVQIAAHILI